MHVQRVPLDLDRHGLSRRTHGFAVGGATLDAELARCPLPFEVQLAIDSNGVLLLKADERVVDNVVEDEKRLRRA